MKTESRKAIPSIWKLGGMRVVIVAAGDNYHAIVQSAQGGVEDPQPDFVQVMVMNVDFPVGSERFQAE